MTNKHDEHSGLEGEGHDSFFHASGSATDIPFSTYDAKQGELGRGWKESGWVLKNLTCSHRAAMCGKPFVSPPRLESLSRTR